MYVISPICLSTNGNVPGTTTKPGPGCRPLPLRHHAPPASGLRRPTRRPQSGRCQPSSPPARRRGQSPCLSEGDHQPRFRVAASHQPPVRQPATRRARRWRARYASAPCCRYCQYSEYGPIGRVAMPPPCEGSSDTPPAEVAAQEPDRSPQGHRGDSEYWEYSLQASS
jgi:hypothetical protein